MRAHTAPPPHPPPGRDTPLPPADLTSPSPVDSCEHIRLNHFHSDEVVKALLLLSRALCSCGEAPYLLLHMHGTQTLELLLRCLSNIDEEVHRRDALPGLAWPGLASHLAASPSLPLALRCSATLATRSTA